MLDYSKSLCCAHFKAARQADSEVARRRRSGPGREAPRGPHSGCDQSRDSQQEGRAGPEAARDSYEEAAGGAENLVAL